MRAYPNLTHEQRVSILVVAFFRGLADKGIDKYLATMNQKTSAKAELVAFAGILMQSEFKSRRSNEIYYGIEVNQMKKNKKNSDSKSNSQSDYEITAAITDQTSRESRSAGREQIGGDPEADAAA